MFLDLDVGMGANPAQYFDHGSIEMNVVGLLGHGATDRTGSFTRSGLWQWDAWVEAGGTDRRDLRNEQPFELGLHGIRLFKGLLDNLRSRREIDWVCDVEDGAY